MKRAGMILILSLLVVCWGNLYSVNAESIDFLGMSLADVDEGEDQVPLSSIEVGVVDENDVNSEAETGTVKIINNSSQCVKIYLDRVYYKDLSSGQTITITSVPEGQHMFFGLNCSGGSHWGPIKFSVGAGQTYTITLS